MMSLSQEVSSDDTMHAHGNRTQACCILFPNGIVCSRKGDNVTQCALHSVSGSPIFSPGFVLTGGAEFIAGQHFCGEAQSGTLKCLW